tara:strand:+ start:306 stop:716 length:411 start_codon:yes stop_codon:yes gene_type:complete
MNNIFNLKTNITYKIDNCLNIITFIEKEYLKNNKPNLTNINVGDIIKVEYNSSLEANKIRIESYEGLIISKKNKNYSQAIILRRNIKGIIVEHTIPLYSPRIKSIIKKKKSKIRKSKLFFIRKLSEKKIKKKLKFY